MKAKASTNRDDNERQHKATFRALHALHALLFAGLLCFASQSVGAEIRAQLDGEVPKVAEPFWLSVSVSAEENDSVVFPEVPSSIGQFDVLSHKDWFDVPVGNARSWTRHFQLESLLSGEFEIPSVPVAVNGETISSKPLTVTINSMVEANADPFNFRDIKKPIEIPAEIAGDSAWVPWLVSGLSITSVLGFVSWLFFRKRILTDSQLAMLQLEQLRNSEEHQRKDARSLSPKIADLLRSYIERRFSIAATRQTTDEFLNRVQRDDRLDESQRTTLRKFLQHIDEIKFAQLDPEEGRLNDSFRIAEDFIRASGTEAR